MRSGSGARWSINTSVSPRTTQRPPPIVAGVSKGSIRTSTASLSAAWSSSSKRCWSSILEVYLSTGRTRLRASQAPDTHSIPRCINRVLGFDTRQHPRTPRHTTLEDGPEKHSRTDRRNTSLGSTGSSSLFRPRTVHSITSGATRVSRCARGSAQSGAASSAFRPSGADVTGDAARPAPRPEDITDASVFLASLATPFGPGGRRFLIWGHAFRFHRAMAGSSRSTARRSVFWQLQPRPVRTFHTCAG
jgi:hypothetical protein